MKLKKSPPAALFPSHHIASPAGCRGHRSPWQHTEPEFYSTAPIMPQERIEPQHTKSSDKTGQTAEGTKVNTSFHRLRIVNWAIVRLNHLDKGSVGPKNLKLVMKCSYWSMLRKHINNGVYLVSVSMSWVHLTKYNTDCQYSLIRHYDSPEDESFCFLAFSEIVCFDHIDV